MSGPSGSTDYLENPISSETVPLSCGLCPSILKQTKLLEIKTFYLNVG
jgi:hypothetical protein